MWWDGVRIGFGVVVLREGGEEDGADGTGCVRAGMGERLLGLVLGLVDILGLWMGEKSLWGVIGSVIRRVVCRVVKSSLGLVCLLLLRLLWIWRVLPIWAKGKGILIHLLGVFFKFRS